MIDNEHAYYLQGLRIGAGSSRNASATKADLARMRADIYADLAAVMEGQEEIHGLLKAMATLARNQADHLERKR